MKLVPKKVGSGKKGVDDDLMRALHNDHASALWSFALHLVGGDRSRAEDVVQETLLRAWRHPRVLDQSQGDQHGQATGTADRGRHGPGSPRLGRRRSTR